MTHAADVLSDILSGPKSTLNQGFLLVLPQGYRLKGEVLRQLRAAYASEAHPDLRMIEPGGKGGVISVDSVREAQPFLASSTSNGGMKTLVILQADRMNISAANALLKPLEEPGRHTRIVLLTDRPGLLPATIRSRCTTFAIAESDEAAREDVLDGLEEDEKAPSAKVISAALEAADMNPRLALEMHRFKLVAWQKKIADWIVSNDPTPPLPATSGKSAPSTEVVALCLQALLVRAARPSSEAPVIAGLDPARAAEAAMAVASRMGDITRAGIDAKTRLHSMLITARQATV